ncbi:MULTISPECIES: MmgE/PrpD family protein [unclassified Pseudomonas]|uniref:MmgE/PrpD family protein n=1 Tax=unclassified Pseudomonas TaxID=196821 RepID=UPI000BD2FDB4|nr:MULTISPECIES: MmgE/PrpD family protein [unclassified Pseudomonas]PVZ20563.1 2-methylcitrate dehydratase PrpD [Pseudomonas sp. URIL14HWK12:I12]PVZ27629.1 2-methylcitrate dehydratase PrpD [Pseudomonas sp. URIL14HWK12:I10]PVZ38518.1 2-methylcitrate dehydratase PrpD [Pseudomonas sp. URIL14HWK12:I11]SNZ03040.1 2-methylcitrate dehydratase PrpD [Pseudomonas sp. URIL14HWK12:I9]
MSLNLQLAQWCADRTLTFPDSAVRAAQTAITDVVGCLLGGRRDAAVVNASQAFPFEGGSASAVTHAAPIGATWAALINGCAAHALDFDDNFFPAVTHASASLVPALLALGEEIEATPADVVRAYIVGLEVEAQIGKQVNPSHYAAGWHATSTIGTIGVAAACAVLMQLDTDGIGQALSVATSLAGGSKCQFGSMVKPLHAGFAAMHGIMAARLAAAGITGAQDTLLGTWSFAELFAGQGQAGSPLPQLFPEVPLAIETYGLVAKLYPSCMSSHLGIDALLELRRRGGFEVARIERVDVHLPAFMVANLRYPCPQTPSEARFSMNYCAAVTLLEGAPQMAHFSAQALARQDIQHLMPRVHRHVRATTPEVAALPWGGDCMARITLDDERVLDTCWTYPKGCSRNPLTAEEQWRKFNDCATGNLDDQAIRPLFEALSGFSGLPTLSPITTRLRLQP